MQLQQPMKPQPIQSQTMQSQPPMQRQQMQSQPPMHIQQPIQTQPLQTQSIENQRLPEIMQSGIDTSLLTTGEISNMSKTETETKNKGTLFSEGIPLRGSKSKYSSYSTYNDTKGYFTENTDTVEYNRYNDNQGYYK